MVPVVLIRQAVLTHAEITTFDADEAAPSREPQDCFANVASTGDRCGVSRLIENSFLKPADSNTKVLSECST
jgi:hypothetical protein